MKGDVEKLRSHGGVKAAGSKRKRKTLLSTQIQHHDILVYPLTRKNNPNDFFGTLPTFYDFSGPNLF